MDDIINIIDVQIRSDIILETIRIVPLFIIFIFLIKKGADIQNKTTGWSFIIVGFGLLLFASVIDLTDNFENLNKYVLIGDTPVQAILEKVIGYLAGFIFLAVGLIKWIPQIIEADKVKEELLTSEKKLSEMNLDLEATVEKRTKALKEAKARLEDKNKELEKLNNMMTGRELKMVELKAQIEKLEGHQIGS